MQNNFDALNFTCYTYIKRILRKKKPAADSLWQTTHDMLNLLNDDSSFGGSSVFLAGLKTRHCP